jgi:hypothetical protein
MRSDLSGSVDVEPTVVPQPCSALHECQDHQATERRRHGTAAAEQLERVKGNNATFNTISFQYCCL